MGGPGIVKKNQRDGRVTSTVKDQFVFLFSKIGSFGRLFFFGRLKASLTTFCDMRHVYWVASTTRLLKIIGLFCKRALQKRRYSAKETYNLKEPPNRSHPIPTFCYISSSVCVYAVVSRTSPWDTHYQFSIKTLPSKETS